MKNPYHILNLSQDATKKEIIVAQKQAMVEKKYSLQEIAYAARQLLDPAKRLAADFMFPTKIRTKRIKPIQHNLTYKELNTDDLDENAFDSLNEIS
jgi:hypothetical protein